MLSFIHANLFNVGSDVGCVTCRCECGSIELAQSLGVEGGWRTRSGRHNIQAGNVLLTLKVLKNESEVEDVGIGKTGAGLSLCEWGCGDSESTADGSDEDITTHVDWVVVVLVVVGLMSYELE